MNKKLEIAQDRLMEMLSRLCDSFGLNKFVAQLYALLYLNDGPLSLDEIVERLKVSKGNVSINIRELERWGAVKNVWVKGSRKDFYEAELDLKKIISGKLKSSMERRLLEISNMLDEVNVIVKSAEPDLCEEEKNMVKVYQDRLGKIEELKKMASTALSFAEKVF